MAEKMAHVELNSPQEVEMRQSMLILLMLFRSPNEPIACTIASTRRVLMATAYALNKARSDVDLTPTMYNDVNQSIRAFGSPDEWLRYYFLFYDIEALRLYINQLFAEVDESDTRLRDGRKKRGGILDCEGLREKIPYGMQVRMRAEVREHLEAFAASTLISKGALQKIVSLNLADLQEVAKEKYRTIERFQPDPDIRMRHGSFKHWLAYYMQEYSLDAIIKLLFDLQATHIKSNIARFVRENAELSSKDWDRVAVKYPQLQSKRDEFHSALCEIVMKDINDICEQYVYGEAAYPLRVRIRPEHMTEIKFVCRLDDDPKISYRIGFKHWEQSVDMSVNTSCVVFIRRIMAGMNVTPPLAVAKGLVSWNSVGEA